MISMAKAKVNETGIKRSVRAHSFWDYQDVASAKGFGVGCAPYICNEETTFYKSQIRWVWLKQKYRVIFYSSPIT